MLILNSAWASSGGPHYFRKAAVVELTALAGVYSSEKYLYPGQSDKKLHARYGFGISTATTAVGLLSAYAISDSVISAKWKERIVGCAGPLVATMAGIGKELKDRTNTAQHSSDVKDAIATAVGGGAPLGCAINFTF